MRGGEAEEALPVELRSGGGGVVELRNGEEGGKLRREVEGDWWRGEDVFQQGRRIFTANFFPSMTSIFPLVPCFVHKRRLVWVSFDRGRARVLADKHV